MTITRKTIDAFWKRCEAGARLTCLDNTFRPRPEGIHHVTRPGKTSVHLVDQDGHDFWLSPPRRVSDVLELDGDTITYRIGRDDHTATWRIES